MKDFLWVMINNLDVILSRVQIQFVHYFPLQIIQHLQLTTYHHVVAFVTWPSKWNPSISPGLLRVHRSIHLYQYSSEIMNLLESQV